VSSLLLCFTFCNGWSCSKRALQSILFTKWKNKIEFSFCSHSISKAKDNEWFPWWSRRCRRNNVLVILVFCFGPKSTFCLFDLDLDLAEQYQNCIGCPWIKFPLMSMGVLAHCLHMLDRSLVPPLAWTEICVRTCLQSHLQTSPQIHQKSYQKFWNPRSTLFT
jgi:hypothetical protein